MSTKRSAQMLITLFLSMMLLLSAIPCLAFAEAPLFEATVALSRGAAMTTFSVYATDEYAPGEDGERLHRLEYTLADGSQAQETIIFPCLAVSDIVPMLRFVDLNFDGFMDIEALRVSGATNTYSTYFINNGNNASFTEAPELARLSSYSLYPASGLILNHEHDSWATGIETLFRWSDGNTKALIFRMTSLLYDEQDTKGETLRLLMREFDAAENETVIYDETHSTDMSEGEYQALWDRQSAFLWHDLGEAEMPLASFLYINPHGGVHYHQNPECESISPRYWDTLVSIERWQLNAAPYETLTPCALCCPHEAQ